MSDHYYAAEPQADSDPFDFKTELRGNTLHLTTDTGVFSRRRLDLGSRFLIEKMVIPKSACVLDMGCGYGPIGLVAARLAMEGTVTLLDVNERAVHLSEQNAKKNGIFNVICLQSNLFAQVQGQTFNVILTNPPIRAGKKVVHLLFQQAYTHLRPDGCLWLVIRKKQGASSAKVKLCELFGVEQVIEVGKKRDYRLYKCIKKLTNFKTKNSFDI